MADGGDAGGGASSQNYAAPAVWTIILFLRDPLNLFFFALFLSLFVH